MIMCHVFYDKAVITCIGSTHNILSINDHMAPSKEDVAKKKREDLKKKLSNQKQMALFGLKG